MNNLNRRYFIQSATLGTTCLGLNSLKPQAQDSKPPNIFLIMVDDLGKEWISCYGADGIETPNVDALASGGLKFENAYSMPQCTPSRVTLLTGQYPWRTGWVNHWDVPRWGVGYFDWKTNYAFPRALQDAGYKTCAAGKWQINDFRLEPQAMRKHGFDDWCMWTGFEADNPPSGKRYWDPYINTPDGSKTYPGDFGPDVYTDYLIDFMRKNHEEPMYLYFPMVLTHGPLVTTPTENNVEGTQEKFSAMVRYMDHCVGRLVGALDKLNIRDNTIIVFTTDNGSPGGINGKRFGKEVKGAKGKKTESGTCAPFIVNCPGRVPVGVTDALTDFTDLAPTFCELAGTAMPESVVLDGKSIAPLFLGETDESPREWIMAMGHGPAKLDERGVRGVDDYASRVIRDQRYKVWVNTERKIHAFYDVEHDPYEENNLLSSLPENLNGNLQNFQRVVDDLPYHDARPTYETRSPNSWDKTLEQ